VRDEDPVNVNEDQIRKVILSVLETELPKYRYYPGCTG
jgi:hypothetical protein